ncbi:MAG: GspH/FimT family pseudopilin [Pseudomonadota bacterium]
MRIFRTSATTTIPSSAARERGLTLIELLVVMAIVGFAVGVVAMNAPPTRAPERDAAERFALLLARAHDAAAVSGRPMRLVVSDTSYAFEEYAPPAWAPARFGRLAAERDAPRGVRFSVEAAEPLGDNAARLAGGGLLSGGVDRTDGDDAAQRIVIDPAGPPRAFRATFKGARAAHVVLYEGGLPAVDGERGAARPVAVIRE